MEKIKVIIADDHPAFREGLCQLLEQEHDLEVVAKAEDGEEAARLAMQLMPDVALLDIVMPKLDGIEAAKRIRVDSPNTAIILLSAYNYDSYLITALQLGAAGYLLKTVPLSDLVNAIRFVHGGVAVFNLKSVSEVLGNLAGDRWSSGDSSRLSEHELQVLKMVAKGKTNKEIGKELVVSERTVQSHLVKIFRKLGVSSRTQALANAIRTGLLSASDMS